MTTKIRTYEEYLNRSEDLKASLNILLVTGSRTIEDKLFVFNYLDYTLKKEFEFDTIMEGEAGWNVERNKWKISVDLLSRLYAEERNLNLIPMKSEWNKYGRGAGMIRNSEMVKLCSKGVAFWDGKSKGTEDTIIKLINENKLIMIFLYDYEQEQVEYALSKYKQFINMSFSLYRRRSFS